MFTESDREWVKANREEITEGRTIAVTLTPVDERENDPFTGEPSGDAPVPFWSTCIWRFYQSVARSEQLAIVENVTVEEGDVEAKFDGDVALQNGMHIERNDDEVPYVVVSFTPAGIGAEYKKIALLRRVT